MLLREYVKGRVIRIKVCSTFFLSGGVIGPVARVSGSWKEAEWDFCHLVTVCGGRSTSTGICFEDCVFLVTYFGMIHSAPCV
jgi:hypothetical protein